MKSTNLHKLDTLLLVKRLSETPSGSSSGWRPQGWEPLTHDETGHNVKRMALHLKRTHNCRSDLTFIDNVGFVAVPWVLPASKLKMHRHILLPGPRRFAHPRIMTHEEEWRRYGTELTTTVRHGVRSAIWIAAFNGLWYLFSIHQNHFILQECILLTRCNAPRWPYASERPLWGETSLIIHLLQLLGMRSKKSTWPGLSYFYALLWLTGYN